MIIFFYFTKDTKILHQEFEFKYEHKFEKIEDKNQISFNKIYFSTPSDFQTHMAALNRQMGKDKVEKEEMVYIIDPDRLINHPQFPVHIGFEKNLEQLLEPHKGKKEVKIAMLNAMSNAIGDHLIGMQAFDYWQEQVRGILKDSEVSITLFQLNPMRLAPITKQWHPKFQQIFMLPNRHQKLLEHDVFVDLGSLLLRENFGNQPMIDFFFEALSIDPKIVPPERKRIKYKLPEGNELSKKLDQVFNVIKSQGRPILLFHHKSTSPIRQMSDERARQYVRNIIDNSDYFVISACGLELSDKRFMDLQSYSQGIDGFASIISRVNSIITIDTSTYHIADAFDIPTVVLFTSIEPEYRIKYYPYVNGIMLEEKGGPLYGRHKMAKKQDAAERELKIVDERFEKIDIKDILKELESANGRIKH